MAKVQTQNHINVQNKLRQIVVAAVVAAWNNLQSYDERDIEPFLAAVLPIVNAGQRQSIALTEAYLAQVLRRQPIGVNHDEIIGSLRGDVTPDEVYRRPFVTVWTALKEGKTWEEAVHAGGARVAATADVDVAMSSRATFKQVQEADEGIYGYQRVAEGGACKFCVAINGAYVKSADASPLHNRCGCSLEPLTRPHPRAAYLPSGAAIERDYAVHEHGELGATLTDPDHSFDGPSVVK